MSRISIIQISGEVALIASGYFVYSIARGLIYDNQALAAFDNAWEIVRLEQAAGVFTEAQLQEWFLDNASGFIYFFNWFYVLGYWPIILPGAVFLYIKYPQVYKKYRTLALITFSIAIVLYETYPLAPPRMLTTLGFVDTIHRFGPDEYHTASDTLLYNPYAAMPSLHIGLPMVVCLGLARHANTVCKLLVIGYLGLMLVTIVVTGNHYYFDALGAVGVVFLAFITYNLWGHLVFKYNNRAPNRRQVATAGTFNHHIIDNDMAKSWGDAAYIS
ncbi:MAG: phosphatase PAP2 family protein [SAR202 cluster bacterium]|nr:phosphatase PAP2 family protein [SAR202 cluster bacterium]MDP6514444.1 phosphatase PAP2 family protein [SAR202 cluster bacterium]